MGRSVKNGNWGCGGLLCIFLSMFNFAFYLLTGRPLLAPRSVTASQQWPLLGSAIFLILGLIGIGMWFVLLVMRRKR